MIRSELVTRIAEQDLHLCTKEAELAVRAILETIAAALAHGKRVELRNFGAFSTRKLRARSGCNPRTGVAVAVQAKIRIRFKPSKRMRAKLNREETCLKEKSPLPRIP